MSWPAAFICNSATDLTDQKASIQVEKPLFIAISYCIYTYVPLGPKLNTPTLIPQIQTFIKDLTEITHEIQRHKLAAVPNLQLLGPINVAN